MYGCIYKSQNQSSEADNKDIPTYIYVPEPVCQVYIDINISNWMYTSQSQSSEVYININYILTYICAA